MNEYAEQQRIRDAQYEAAWKTLTAAQRKQMSKLGITGPDKPTYRTGKPDQETYIERAAAVRDSERYDAIESVDGDTTTAVDQEALWAALRRLVALIESEDNIRLSMDCFSLVTNMHYSGESMAEIARRHGVTRAAVSKRCVEFTESLGIKPALGMRQLTTRKRYELRARNCHRKDAY
jgi:hypothetical protein